MVGKAAVFFVLVILAVGFLSASQQSMTRSLSEITTEPLESERVLSRKRRYVVFPQGSSIQAVYCDTIRTYMPLTKRFNLGITLGLAWMLPSEAHELYLQKRDVDHTRSALTKAGYGVQHRVDMYKMLEGLLTLKRLNGRDCLMRAVCEASEIKQAQTSSGHQPGTIMEELHKILFGLPIHPRHKTSYDEARKHAGHCGQIYSGCHSFLDFYL